MNDIDHIRSLANRFIEEIRTVYYMPTEYVRYEEDQFTYALPHGSRIVFLIKKEDECKFLKEVNKRNLNAEKLCLDDRLDVLEILMKATRKVVDTG